MAPPLDLEGAWGGAGAMGRRRVAALQPTAYAPFAQWALLSAETPTYQIPGTDRSGNGRHLSTAPALGIDDLIPGQRSGYCATDPACAWGRGAGAASIPFRDAALGNCTITARVRPPTYLLGGSRACVSISGNGGANERIVLEMNMFAAPGDGFLRSFWQDGAGASVDFTSTLYLADGHWHFISYRRSAGYVVTLGMDGVFQTSGALAAPGTCNTPDVQIGVHNASRRWLGQVADVSFWDRRLTDDEVNAQGRIAMGAY